MPELKDEVAQRALALLRRAGAVSANYVASEARIEISMGPGNEASLVLENLTELCRKAPRDLWDAVITRHLQALTESQKLSQLFQDYSKSLVNLIPVIRHESLAKVPAKEVALLRGSALPGATALVHRPFAGELLEALVLDMPTSMAFVTRSTTQDWHIADPQLFAQALRNLQQRTPAKGSFREIGPGVFKSTWDDGYDSSRLLLPELLRTLELQSPVALAPCPGLLYLTRGDNAQSRELMARLALRDIEKQTRILALNFLHLQPDDHWRIDYEEPVSAALRALDKGEAANLYNSRAKELTTLFAQQSENAHAAPVRILKHPDHGPCLVTVWAPGASPLLIAQTDLVMLAAVQDGKLASVALPWLDMFRRFGERLTEVESRGARKWWRAAGPLSFEEVAAQPGVAFHAAPKP